MQPKSPLLAETIVDVRRQVKYPCIASPKLDGIRCLTILVDGKVRAVSRKMKPIPNKHIRETIEAQCPAGLDGEIIVPGKEFHDVSSAVMGEKGTPNFRYACFDFAPRWMDICMAKPFSFRFADLKNFKRDAHPECCADVVSHRTIQCEEELLAYEVYCLEHGYEGVMVRKPDGHYKQGRSTVNEHILLKLKRFAQDEATVIGYTEFMHNSNEGVRDAVGNMKRSSAKAGQVGMGKLGALICAPGKATAEDYKWAEQNKHNLDVAAAKSDRYFGIGTGFTDEQRVDMWSKARLLGTIVTFKHQPSGAKAGGKPRFPVFIGFRNKIDM